MIYIRTIFTILLLFCTCSFASALTLEEAYKNASANSYVLFAKRFSMNIAGEKIRIARSEFFPRISISGVSKYTQDLNEKTIRTSYSGSTEVEVDNTEYSFAAYLSMNYDFFNFGAGKLRYKNSLIDYEQAEKELEYAETQTKMQILETYINCLKKQYELENSTTLLTLKQNIYEITSKLHELGELGTIDYLDSAVNVAEQNRHFSKIREDLSLLILKLSELAYMDLNSDSKLELSLPDNNTYGIEIDKFPEIILLKNQIRQKENEYRIVQKQRLPSLSAFANYSLYKSDETSYNDTFDKARPESAIIGISASMPLFDGFKTSATVKALKYEINQLNYELKQKRHEKEYEVKSTKASLHSSIESLHLSETVSALAQSGAEVAAKLKENHSISSIELLQKLIEIETKHLHKTLLKADQMFHYEKLKIYSLGG